MNPIRSHTTRNVRRSRLSARPALEALERRALMDGNPDPGFDTDGFVSTHVGLSATPSLAWDLALYPASGTDDCKILAVGTAASRLVGGSPDYDFALARYNTNGTLDTTFNGTGTVITPMSTSGNDQAMSVALVDTKIIAAGFANAGTGGFAVARYNDNGSLDATFGSRGKVVTTLSSRGLNKGLAMKVDTLSRIVVAGVTGTSSAPSLGLVRYTSSGALDTSFNGSGKVISSLGTPLDGNNQNMDMALDGGGNILVAAQLDGSSQTSVVIARYTSTGALDTSFDHDGIVVLASVSGVANLSPSVVATSDGHIVAAYNGGGSITLVRLNADGSYDTTFGSGGVVTTSTAGVNYAASDVALATVNSIPMIYVAGTAADSGGVNPGGNYFAARYTSAGALDTSYGSSGFALSPGNQTAKDGTTVNLQIQANNGKAVVAGEAQTFNPDGSVASRNFGLARFDGPSAQPSTATPGQTPTLIAALVDEVIGSGWAGELKPSHESGHPRNRLLWWATR